ncbi:MAG TPA: YihY/virulence factor BrkB family protein [Halococcus sp.]|nr:YihY/virulence factor BrkB family protein [Halococcus sp.]
MKPALERTLSVLRGIIHELRTENITFIAGSIAYHAFVSLLPLLVLVLTVLSIVGNPQEKALIDLVGAVLTENTGEALLRQLDAAGTGLSVLGIVFLVWGALRIFRGLDTAFSAIYETESQNTITDQFTDAVVVFFTFGLAIAAAWAIDALLDSVGPAAWLFGRVVLVCGLAATFFPMYYIFPDTDVTVREVIPGVLVAAIGLVGLISVFQLYAAYKAAGSESVILGILVFLTWLYFSGLIVLVGAAVNAVLSNRSHDVNIDPVIGHYRTDTEHDTTRKHLIHDLHELAANADDGDELVISCNDSEIRLPSPQHATVDTDGAMFGIGDESVGIELRWLPREQTERN